MAWLTANFGSRRGLLRFMRHEATWRLNRHLLRPSQLDRYERLVFICQGNVCRSALGQAVAHSRNVPSASFGLATHRGKPADARMQHVAQDLGYDLSRHRTTPIEEYAPGAGDLLLLMQPDHWQQLASVLSHPGQTTLLGLWARPSRAYIHDPFSGSDDYLRHSARVIEDATNRLIESDLIAR